MTRKAAPPPEPGQAFGCLTVEAPAGQSWWCRCRCGNRVRVCASRLRK